MKKLILMVLLFAANSAFASNVATYYVISTVSGKFSTCLAALNAGTQYHVSIGNSIIETKIPWSDGGSCAGFYWGKNGVTKGFSYVTSKTHACPVGKFYHFTADNQIICNDTDPNPPEPVEPALCDQEGATKDNPKVRDKDGKCVGFKDVDKESACKYLGSQKSKMSVTMAYDHVLGTSVIPDTVAHKLGCQVRVVEAYECVAPPQHCRGGICVQHESRCTVSVEFTGDASASPEIPQDKVCLNGNCQAQKVETQKETANCEMVSDGNGGQKCNSYTLTYRPTIDSSESTTNGFVTGSEKDVTEKTNVKEDNSSSTTQTATVYKYNCTGSKCNTTTTVSTTIINKDASGNVIGKNSTCEGPACKGSTPGSDGDQGEGSGMGSCGFDGIPCQIDDSAFADLPTDANGFSEKLQGDQDQWLQKINATRFDDMHGVDLSFTSAFPRASCEAIRYGLPGKFLTIDWCEKAALIRSVLVWLLYLFTAWFIFDSFFSSTTRTAK